MAWKFDNSTLDRYCPNFEPEFPPGVVYATTEIHKADRGLPLAGDTLPRRMRQTTAHKHLPDFLRLNGQLVVSDAFRRLVEAREPGVHQFFSVEVLDKAGTRIDRSYFIFVVCQRVDAVIVEQSKIQWFTRPDGSTVPVGAFGHLVLDKKVIAGKHVWRNWPYFSSAEFISSDLKEAIESARLEKLEYTEIREADR
jgi:hypothetical protein